MTEHADMANAIRALAMDAVEAANSGHPGMPMGMADAATVLFTRHLKFDPTRPDWPDRDRFVLSAGHGSMLLYAVLYLTGYADMTLDEIKRFRQLGARTAGHPEYGAASGIEMTTGPLGQGLGAAVVSMPCWELFKRQPREYRHEVLGNGPRMGIEAAVRDGWEQWIGSEGLFIGMVGFGASAPAPALYEKFGITPEWVAGAASSLIL